MSISRVVRWLVVVGLVFSASCRGHAPESRGAPPQDNATGSVAEVAPVGSGEASPRQIRLLARDGLGVPVHPQPESATVSARLPDGSNVVVEEESADGRWLRVRAAGNVAGWVTRRYVAEDRPVVAAPAQQSAAPTSPAASAAPVEPGSLWASPAQCEKKQLERGNAKRTSNVARIATWNLRWFPDGGPGTADPGQGTDIAWLACAIASLDAEVLAVQEIKDRPASRARSAELLAALDRHTGGSWALELDRCGKQSAQHVGFLYDTRRVKASNWHTYASLNPHGDACKDQLRPGFGGYFRFPGGLDLHVVSLHLKSGPERRALELRDRSIAGIPALYAETQRVEADQDVVLAGDFNSMGCAQCSPPISAGDELAAFARKLGLLKPAFRRVEPSEPCSQYFRGNGVLLDHFAVSAELAELPSDRRSIVKGPCSEAACRPLAEPPLSQKRLSDHCPLVLELDATDRD